MIKKWLFFSFLFISSCFADEKYYLSVATIFRDEAPYLKEWIEFHRLLGVEHFYLCSHNSIDNYREVLAPYIEKGIVELKEISDHSLEADKQQFCFGIQLDWYNECMEKARGVSKWVAVIDADEFLYPTQENSLVEFLKDYEEFAGVSANWLMFGTSHISHLSSDKLMIEQFTSCAPYEHRSQLFVKTIVQPIYVTKFKSPHDAKFLPGYYPVNANKNPLKNAAISDIALDKIRINHYWTRDEDYFWNVKVARQIQFYGNADNARRQYYDFNQSTDLAIQRFVPKLRERMKLK